MLFEGRARRVHKMDLLWERHVDRGQSSRIWLPRCMKPLSRCCATRLCTTAELSLGCKGSTSCGHDHSDLIWSSTVSDWPPDCPTELATLTLRALLTDQGSIISVLSAWETCSSCVLQTVVFLCGKGCIEHLLHITSTKVDANYSTSPCTKVDASLCLPELATQLIAQQGTAFAAAVVASLPVGI